MRYLGLDTAAAAARGQLSGVARTNKDETHARTGSLASEPSRRPTKRPPGAKWHREEISSAHSHHHQHHDGHS